MVTPTLENLVIQHVRNIDTASLDNFSNINVIYGLNGSGKTTVLEAINLLGLTRSFRTNNIRSVINREKSECTVFSNINTKNGKTRIPVGVTRYRSGKRNILANKEKLNTTSELARLLPIQVINSDTFKLLEGGPKERRQFLDWGVFHVEHQFGAMWSRLSRTIKQRNSLLRRGKIDKSEIEVWDNELCSISPEIHRLRVNYFDHLSRVFYSIWQTLDIGMSVTIRYDAGWDVNRGLKEQLFETYERDQKVGLTNLGPHRTSFKVLHDNMSVEQCFSRGQQKMVILALKVAQGQILKELIGRQSIYLVDDLPSELDEQNKYVFCRLLEDIGAQIFITAVASTSLQNCWSEKGNIKMFHVEHGIVTGI